MWPFKSKTAPTEVENVPSKWAMEQSRIQALRAWRDVGQEFEYLGRRMVVVAHSRVEFSGVMVWLVPEVRARYADNAGKVHELTFCESEALALARLSDLQPNARLSG
jgi:hypothetical protein